MFNKKKKPEEYRRVPEPKQIEEETNPMDEAIDESKADDIEEMDEEIGPKMKKKDWSLREVTVQSDTVIYNEKEKKAYTLAQAIVEILNRTGE